jgi:mannose-6-phosphate isomerase-like protein (cupin superfamily)
MPVKNSENAEHYTWGIACDGWRLLNGLDLAVIRERIPPGHGEVRHFHERSHQLFYVLEGMLEIEMNSETFRLGTGDSLEIPPSTSHKVWNPFGQQVDILVVSAPSTSGDRVNLESTSPSS